MTALAISDGRITGIPEQLANGVPHAFHNHYQWHSHTNLLHVVASLEAAWIVLANNLGTQQFGIHMDAVRDTFSKDQIERVHDFVLARFGYNGDVYHHDRDFGDGFERILEQRRERVKVRGWFESMVDGFPTHQEKQYTKWLYYRPPTAYREAIPLQALRVLSALSAAGITPEQRWVADFYEGSSGPQRQLPDPYLCVSFGRWVAAIAEWL